ncbi:MAG: hypothetical protein ABI673_04460 [Novosphingobium sp.]
MGISNITYGLEQKIAHYRGELAGAQAEMKMIETGVMRLIPLQKRIVELEGLIESAARIIIDDHPEWRADKIKPVKKRVWNNPFKSGDMGRTALAILRERGDWLRPSDVAKIMLDQLGHDPVDRHAREKIANSLGNYFRKHAGDLVESRGDYAKEWRVIRDNPA